MDDYANSEIINSGTNEQIAIVDSDLLMVSDTS